ncbi:MAG: sugar transferase [Clostridia bacterium]|nr:sugar transferase [Clostridia bacterium]
MKYLIKFHTSIMVIVKGLVLACLTSSFVDTWQNHYPKALFSKNGNYVVVLSYLIFLIAFIQLYGGFRFGVYRLHEIIYDLSLATIFSNFVMFLELCLIARELLFPVPLIFCTFFQIVLIFLCSYCANVIYFRLYPALKMLVVFGEDKEGFALIDKFTKIPERFKIEKGFSVEGKTPEEIEKQIDKYDAVLITDFDKSIKDSVLRYCYTKRKRTYILPSSTDVVISTADPIQVFDTPVLLCHNRGITLEQAAIKRFFDILLSTIGLIVTSPIFLLVPLFIKLEDKGPVFYKQNRVTKDGKIFNIYKFRSMIVDADKNGARKAENDDDRITKTGKIIRPLRIDELPQLLNIFFGDMSLVGPRPERLQNVYDYTNLYPDFDLRHRVKAGLTGYAQVYGKYNTAPADKLKMDLMYIEKYSLILDMKLIAITLKILFLRESTQGFTSDDNKNTRGAKYIEKEDDKK